MRVVWAMVRVQMLELVRDRKALLLVMLMPVVLTAILGFALGGMFEGKPLPVVRVVVADLDRGGYGRQLTAFLKSQSVFRVSEADSAGAARQSLASGDADVAVVVPDHATGVIDSGRSARVDVEAPVNQWFDQKVVQQFINGFGARWSAVRTAVAGGLPPSSAAAQQPLHIAETSPGIRPLDAKTYYAYGMTAMFLLLHAAQRAGVMVRARESDQSKRIAAAPVSASVVVAGDLISTLLLLTVQCTVLFAAYRILLGATIGPPAQMMVLTAAYLLALAGLAVAVGRWVRSDSVVDGLTGVGVNVLAVLGGSMYPVYGFPAGLQRLAAFLPNGRILRAWVDCAMGVPWHEVWTAAVYLLAVAAVFVAGAQLRRAATP